MPASEAKERSSRMARHRKKEARLRKRLIVGFLVVLAAVLTAGSFLDLPFINFPRRAYSWVRDRLTASGGTSEKGCPDYLFLTHPQTGKRLEGKVSVLLGVNGIQEEGQRGNLLALFLLTYYPDEGKTELFLVPEITTAYNAVGEPIQLKRCPTEEKGEDLMRSTVENMTGLTVDYLVFCDFRKAVLVMQSLDLPPVVLKETTTFNNPVNGETQTLFAGQETRDADRLLFFLLATDRPDFWDGYYTRLERVKDYLPEALRAAASREEGRSYGEIFRTGEGLRMVPGTGSAEGDAAYLASMFRAAADSSGREIICRGVPRVEVLNGCGVPELGRMVGERLAGMGVPLAGTGGNAKVMVNGEEVNDFSHQESEIVCRSSDPMARAFARYLGVLLSIEAFREETGPGPQVAIIAGRDMAP